MKTIRTLGGLAVICAVAVTGPAHAQSSTQTEIIGNRECAIPGTELYQTLENELPGCARYCAVDQSTVAGFETFPGLVFACSDPGGVPIVVNGNDGIGLSGAAIGAVLGAGLLLGVAAGAQGGSTNNTTN